LLKQAVYVVWAFCLPYATGEPPVPQLIQCAGGTDTFSETVVRESAMNHNSERCRTPTKHGSRRPGAVLCTSVSAEPIPAEFLGHGAG